METTQKELEEFRAATQREDSIWLSLNPGKAKISKVIDWEDIGVINGDFGNIDSVVIVGVPLYGNTDEVLHNATRYVFNQIEIFEKTKENKKLFTQIGMV